MKNIDLLFSQAISRKQFISVIALATSGLIMPAFLTRCSSSNYIQISQQIRNKPINKNAHHNQPIEVPDVRNQLREHLKLGTMKPQLLIRFGYVKPMPYSLRRPVDAILAV